MKHVFVLAIGCSLLTAACGSGDVGGDPKDGSSGVGGGGGASTTATTSSTTSVTGTTTASAGAGGSSTESSTAAGGPFVPASHGAPPEVVDLGGKVLANPKVVAITWADDPINNDVDAFLAQMASSSYWSAVTSEYGVGALTVLPTLHLPGSSPSSANANTFLGALDENTKTASSPWGALDPETIYMFVLPQGIAFDDGEGGGCCGDYDGFHDEAIVTAGSAPYAFICQCSDINETTVTMSHEIVEASTDPYVETTNGAYVMEDAQHAAWTMITSGEVGDMCEYNLDSAFTPQGMSYEVQRTWSNAAAAAGLDPCVPHASPVPYFNSVPVANDTVNVDVYGQATQTEGIYIPVGQSKMVEVDLFSSGPVDAPWTVSATDASGALDGDSYLDFTWDKTSGNNGDKLHLTIQVLKKDTNNGGELFWIDSQYAGQDNIWMGVVGN